MLQVADRALDRPRRLAAGTADRIERPDRVQDGAADPEDRVRLERRGRFGLVGVDRPQQPQHAGLHCVFMVEEARDRDPEAADHVLDQVRVARDQLVTTQAGARRRHVAVGVVAGEVRRVGSQRERVGRWHVGLLTVLCGGERLRIVGGARRAGWRFCRGGFVAGFAVRTGVVAPANAAVGRHPVRRGASCSGSELRTGQRRWFHERLHYPGGSGFAEQARNRTGCHGPVDGGGCVERGQELSVKHRAASSASRASGNG